MKNFADEQECKQIQPFWLWPVPQERRCQAWSKQAKRQCRKWAVPGKRVCCIHGGKSSGIKTQAGKAAQRKSVLKHGRWSLDQRKQKLLDRIAKALEAEGMPSGREAFRRTMEPMTIKQFEEYRAKTLKQIKETRALKELRQSRKEKP